MEIKFEDEHSLMIKGASINHFKTERIDVSIKMFEMYIYEIYILSMYI